ncbi:MAG: hypothetical protein KAJ19_08480, partial [Gammaproteobacteria bacterium]|nr:hypothetical protein [Gammaproteobacteria bacterium]
DSNEVTVSATGASGQSILKLDHVMNSWGLTGKTFTIRVSETNAFNYQSGGATFAAALYGAGPSETLFAIIEYE